MASAPLLTQPRLRALAPDPPAAVRVRNLATTLRRAGRDAWGRPRRAQPCLVSAEVAFREAFTAAAASDRLGADTVHYGTLSKAVLRSIELFEGGAWEEEEEEERSLRDVLGRVWLDLTGSELLLLDGGRTARTGQEGPKGEGFLDLSKVRLLSVTVTLPKASLLGDGVSLTASAVFDSAGAVEGRAMALEVSRLKVPTLVGVNANERLAKQFVISTATVERFTRAEDVYTDIERDIVAAMENSSFETLEALGAHLAETVLSSGWHEDGWQVCIRMEKPTAVPMADCPIVEVRATRESSLKEKKAGTS
ncbi:uncharacterized protein P884DRAFT_327339 [Thermothelomyces heterothallicus CBS 202.75]|uniref:uncharacterized protein n=1 Tax=Thermothelomyces heterothallicus CBS 202.75 TaxID=1149848 RepID=UPI003742D5CD